MPVSLEGVKGTIAALRKYDPELLKEMNQEIKSVMLPIRDKARSYAPSPVPGNLYNWNEGTKGRKITARNSAFRTLNVGKSGRLFPLYDHQEAVKGIYYSQSPTKRNNSGCRLYIMLQIHLHLDQYLKLLAVKIQAVATEANLITQAQVLIL